MSFRIGDYVSRGELRNTRANSVFGWLEFTHDFGLHIELTGNLLGRLAGKHIKFSVRNSRASHAVDHSALPPEILALADRQIGVIGEVVLRRVQVPTIPLSEFENLAKQDQGRFSEEKECLVLVWFSQNGQVVAEILDPEIEFLSEQQSEESEAPEFEALNDSISSEIAEVYLDNDGAAELGDFELSDATDDEDEEDPYGLFDSDLDRSLAESLGIDKSADTPPRPRSWDEVIPGIDPETKAMYEQWDEIFEGKKDEPVAYLFETPLRLPPPDSVVSNEEANALVVSILAQLALLSVAVDVCEHFTPLQTYRLLMTEILPTAKVHPNLAASKMVQHYSTSDYCETCDAEFDEEFDSDHHDGE